MTVWTSVGLAIPYLINHPNGEENNEKAEAAVPVLIMAAIPLFSYLSYQAISEGGKQIKSLAKLTNETDQKQQGHFLVSLHDQQSNRTLINVPLNLSINPGDEIQVNVEVRDSSQKADKYLLGRTQIAKKRSEVFRV
jgi:ABC-type transport system involved in cytochrome bd biosynthesis fused ATPase/permease subunit